MSIIVPYDENENIDDALSSQHSYLQPMPCERARAVQGLDTVT
jgi:hypothetical protein